MNCDDFKALIWSFYTTNQRIFPWRHVADPYQVLVSEIMLQQTQTSRVIEKYQQFIAKFPTIFTLASASLADVLAVWVGLGYNRRALFLHQLAVVVVKDYQGVIPASFDQLKVLPGIGPATAGSMLAFAFNKPSVFIETNIRTVFLYCFFSGQSQVSDAQLMPYIAQTVDQAHPRDWYYALMDYGVFLKKNCINPSRQSKHHLRQSTFEGSDRQVRGKIIALLLEKKEVSFDQLKLVLVMQEARLRKIIGGMIKDQLVVVKDELYSIK